LNGELSFVGAYARYCWCTRWRRGLELPDGWMNAVMLYFLCAMQRYLQV
jgi:hypothetical protein